MKQKIHELMSLLQDYIDDRLDTEDIIDDHVNEFEFIRDCLNKLEIMEIRIK